MNCGACGHANPERAKFCLECGAPFAVRCASCGVELPPAAKFCLECGTATGAPPAAPPRPTDTRKIVTIVFADLVGSTALHERLDPESARRFMESYYAAMRGAVESHGGTVTQLLGDGVKAVFGIPRVAEDDAIRAVRAAVAMQEAFRALAERQRGAVGKTGLRVAVNTGEVVANDETEIIGDPVNVAARLQEQGKDGDVVVGESTHRLVSTRVTLELLGSFALKGRSEAVKAYRVISLERPAGAATAPFVGRREELERLTEVYTTAVEKPAAALAVLVGSPGLGKSRLIDEFARRSGESATVIRAHCDAAGGATFAPLAQALRALLGIEDGADADVLQATLEAALPEDADRARIASGVAALVSGSPASPEETFFVVRRLLGALAQTKPVVLVVDDLHWAEPLLLDLVEHLIQWGSGVPLFVLIGARPELRDLRSSLVTPGGLVSDVITLAGLDARAAMRLAANVIGAADLPAAVAAKVLSTSEGNPLFVGELVRMLVQEGALTKDGERWTVGANLAALEMPPTIHALLAARIERLRPEERTVLERAAVVGRHFSRSAVAALMPREAADLDARLEALRRSELIERDTGWLLGEPVLRFHHVLIRDAAYRRLLKGTRAELHATLADWIEAQAGDAPEHDETIGWHLEQAHAFLGDLGPLDESGKKLGARAAQRLAAAGRRALARDDLPVAADLLGRAIERLDAGDPARADLAVDWCEALLAAGDVGPAAAAIAELARFTADSDRLRAWHTCFAGQHTVLTAPSQLHATTVAVAAAAETLTAQGDAAGEAKAHFVHALALSRLGKVGACEAALDRALAAARRAGDRRRANTVLAIAPLAALWGPSPVTRASGRCLDVVRVLRITQGAPAVEAVALSCQGVLEALRGRGDAARRMIASARKMVEELGITQRLLEADVFGGLVELLEGDAPAAERNLRAAYEGLRELGLGIDAARAAALLARALLAQGRVDEAEALSHESEALAGDDLKAAIAWRGVRAEAQAKRGEHAAAIALATRAVELAAATDALLDHADARLALAAALRAAGRRGDADAEERRARDLWQAKGATLLAERAPPAAAPVASPVAAAAPSTDHTARRRPVRPNFAFEEMRRAEAAVAARDARALETLYRRDIEIVDHQFGITYGYDAIVERVRAIIEDSTDSAFAHEPLASLGDSLALCRMRSTASGSTAHGTSIGATEAPYLLVIEADEQGSARHIEIFGDDKLADAVVRLYERHAELLPDGPERTRAAMTARSFAAVGWSGGDPEQRLPAVLASDFVGVDHRHLSNWSLRGAAAYIEHLRALKQVADDIEFRQLDLLALGPNAQLLRVLHTGTDRASGGVYERPFLSLFATDADGRLVRGEWFDADREAEAVTRFEALTAPAAAQSSTRRVHANAATAVAARVDAAFAAGDLDAFAALLAPSLEFVDHPVGASYGHADSMAGIRAQLRAHEPRWHQEPIATLGERVGLLRRRVSARATAGTHFDVGASETVDLPVCETDGAGATVERIEVFAADRLGDAIVCLYERYAEQLPEGAARTRAKATARTVAVVAPGGFHRDGRFDLDAYEAVFRPDVEIVDHKLVSGGATRGTQAQFRLMAATTEIGEQVESRCRDVLALAPDGLLLRWLVTGVARESGGAFEWGFLRLFVFGSDGRVARYELFDDDREADALARFDALAAERATSRVAPSRVHANAATRSVERFVAVLEARDADALPAFFDDALRVVHHPSGSTYGRREMLATWRSALRAERIEFRGQPIASLGDTLVLSRQVTAVAGLRESHLADFGATEVDEISLVETDAGGRWIHVELFAPDRLGDAVVRLYERHAAQQPEGPLRDRATRLAHAVAILSGPIDLDRMTGGLAPDARNTDHRVFATWSAGSGAELVDHFRRHLELAPDFASRIDEVLALEADCVAARITFVGTSRDSGGAFENRLCVVYRFGDDGRMVQIESFEAEQAAEALACFDALAVRSSGVPAKPFANAASRYNDRFVRAWDARDWNAVREIHRATCRVDDRRRMMRIEGPAEDGFRFFFDQPRSRWIVTPIATRGERLVLSRLRLECDVEAEGGAAAIDYLCVDEVDADGLSVAMVVFDPDDEDAAHAELDARFEAGEGAAHGRVVGEFVRAIAGRDWDAVAALCSPAFVEHDHRRLAVLGTTHGAEAWMRNFRALVELAPDTIYRSHHVRAAARGFLSVGTWQGSREGGRYEIPLTAVLEVDAHGAISRADLYESDQQDQALARFEALKGRDAEAPAEPFANAASRLVEHGIRRLWVARDWDGIVAMISPAIRMDDRRRLIRLEVGYDDFLAQFRMIFEQPGSRWRSRLVATRGERLALCRMCFEADVADGGGPLAIDEHWSVAELDAEGRIAAFVTFDLEDEGAAYAELDARFEAGEGAAHPHALAAQVGMNAAIRSRDWDALAAFCAPTFRMRDHRLLGWGTMVNDAATFASVIRSAVELAPDARYRDDHVRICARGNVAAMVLCGTRDGGAFENPLLRVTEVDARGRILSHDTYDESDVDRALARFAELAAIAAPEGRFENAASRAWRAAIDAWRTRDVPRFEALHPRALRYRDRRRLFQLDLDRQGFLDFTRPLLTMRSAGVSIELLATRGEHLALLRFTLTMEDETVGPSAIDSLLLVETDERGDIAAYDRWDLEDEDAAWAEIEARWAGEDSQRSGLSFMQQFAAALERRDWDAVAACYTPDFVGHDHRLVSWGTVHGPSALVRTLEEMVALAPDARMRTNHRRKHGRGTINDITWVGTRDGGAFESAFVTVTELDADGRIARADFYDSHHLDRALARFEELRPDPLRIPPNAATRATDRLAPLLARSGLDALRSFAADDFCFDDRTRRGQVRGGVEEWLAGLAFLRTESRARLETRLVATAGDRIALDQIVWREMPGESSFQIERLRLIEVDAVGQLRAFVLFDPDDRAAAHDELRERWIASGADGQPACVIEFIRGIAARDLGRMRAALADDFVYHDRRRTGAGRIDGPDAYLASPRAWWELSEDARMDALHHAAVAPHGFVAVNRMAGRNLEGGDFESFLVALVWTHGGRLAGAEIFEIDQLDAALARFEELRPEAHAPAIPPTIATRLRDRHRDAFLARDWDAMRALAGADFVYEDRGRRALVRGDVEGWITSMQFTSQPGFRADTALIGTLGDRIVLDQVRWFGKPGGDAFEFERVRLLEVGADGLLRAVLFFDPEDRSAASVEGLARFAAGEAAGSAGARPLTALSRALLDRDWEAVRECFAPDLVVVDHRPLSLGTLDREPWIASLQAVDELGDGVVWEVFRVLACSEQGFVKGVRRLGTIADGGGPFENEVYAAALVADGRIQRYEVFGEADAERAVARFEALCSTAGAVPFRA